MRTLLSGFAGMSLSGRHLMCLNFCKSKCTIRFVMLFLDYQKVLFCDIIREVFDLFQMGIIDCGTSKNEFL